MRPGGGLATAVHNAKVLAKNTGSWEFTLSRKCRNLFREAMARDIPESFKRSGYSVLGSIGERGPIPRVYMGIDLDKLDDGHS